MMKGGTTTWVAKMMSKLPYPERTVKFISFCQLLGSQNLFFSHTLTLTQPHPLIPSLAHSQTPALNLTLTLALASLSLLITMSKLPHPEWAGDGGREGRGVEPKAEKNLGFLAQPDPDGLCRWWGAPDHRIVSEIVR